MTRASLPFLAIAAVLAACSGSGPESAAFSDAKDAVKKAARNDGVTISGLQLFQRTGLRGSKAQVVCGVLRLDEGGGGNPSVTPFIYIWTLTRAVAEPKIRQGEVKLFASLNRQAVAQLARYCAAADTTKASEWTYFD